MKTYYSKALKYLQSIKSEVQTINLYLMQVSIKQVNDLCSLIAETLSLDHFDSEKQCLFNHYLEAEFDYFPRVVRDHVRTIVSRAMFRK